MASRLEKCHELTPGTPLVRRAAGTSNLPPGRPSSRHFQIAIAHSAESPEGPQRSGGRQRR